MSAIVVLCAAVILMRTLCVLDHMTPHTRWLVQLVYALQAAGATTMGVTALLGSTFQFGAVVLLVGVAAAYVFDGRIYPPRLVRLRGRGRRKGDDRPRVVS